MSLKGFGFSGYRSFGDKLAVIAPLKKINFIIGKNNSGKSNIVYFLKKHLAEVVTRIGSVQSNGSTNFSELDRHIPNPASIKFAYPFDAGEKQSRIYAKTLAIKHQISCKQTALFGWKGHQIAFILTSGYRLGITAFRKGFTTPLCFLEDGLLVI